MIWPSGRGTSLGWKISRVVVRDTAVHKFHRSLMVMCARRDKARLMWEVGEGFTCSLPAAVALRQYGWCGVTLSSFGKVMLELQYPTNFKSKCDIYTSIFTLYNVRRVEHDRIRRRVSLVRVQRVSHHKFGTNTTTASSPSSSNPSACATCNSKNSSPSNPKPSTT